jgi:hypothetical protein
MVLFKRVQLLKNTVPEVKRYAQYLDGDATPSPPT